MFTISGASNITLKSQIIVYVIKHMTENDYIYIKKTKKHLYFIFEGWCKSGY